MADKTKAELLEEIERLNETNEQLQNSPLATDANYQKEIQRLTVKAEKAESEVVRLKEKAATEKRDRETLANDRKVAEERKLKQFEELPPQNGESRFRMFPKSTGANRDIFGDPTSPVFDMRVNLRNYTGGIFIPVAVVIEAAQSIGMLTKEQSDSIKSELADTTAKVESAGAIAQELVDGISSCVDRFYSDLGNVVASDDPADSKSGESDKDAGKTSGQAPDSDLGKESNGIPSGSIDGSADGKSESKSPSFFGSLGA